MHGLIWTLVFVLRLLSPASNLKWPPRKLNVGEITRASCSIVMPIRSLVESGQELVQQIPWVTYGIVILVATALLLLGCWILQRRILNYLSTFRSMSYYERRSFKRWTVVLTILFLIPPVVAGWFIINSTSTATKFIDLRTTNIAQRVLFDAIDDSMARIERYATGDALTGLVSDSPDTLAEQVRLANDFDFVLIEEGSEVVQPNGGTGFAKFQTMQPLLSKHLQLAASVQFQLARTLLWPPSKHCRMQPVRLAAFAWGNDYETLSKWHRSI